MSEQKRAPLSRSVLQVQEGASVRVRTTGIRGKVIEVSRDRVILEAGELKLDMALSEIEAITARPEGIQGDQDRGWQGPELGTGRLEVDLHGMRVNQVELELSRALDDAVLGDLSEIRVIHGKGTGALRKRVAEILEKDLRVVDTRMGYPYEGGAGVTIVMFGGEP